MRAVLFETSVGFALMVQMGAALLLGATCALPARMRSGGTALASGLLLVTLALTGHAAMHEGGLGLAHRLNDAVHVLAGGAWLGALVPYGAIRALRQATVAEIALGIVVVRLVSVFGLLEPA